MDLEPEDIDAVFDEYDTDHSNTISYAEYKRLVWHHRHLYSGPGVNTVTLLMLYEAITFTTVVLLVLLNGYFNVGPPAFWESSSNFVWYSFNVMLYGPEEPVVRLTLYFGIAIGSVVSFLPFLIFKIPMLGRALIRIPPTGYDQAGNLRPTLTSHQKLTKARKEKEAGKYAGKRHMGAFFHRASAVSPLRQV
mmetsp:Transcript_34800/g.76555  ORF Transcript_34800/g.76555 Transcript_34800/m.76555 type:complete len:192 (+) Transcript_34800:413-988(+)